MQLDEYRQLRAYTRYDGIYLGILWLASFACTVFSSLGAFIGAAGNLLIIATPFFVGYRLKKYRNEALGGNISFSRALLYCVRVFLDGALLFAICQWLYMKFLDGGQLLANYQTMMNMPEMKPILDAMLQANHMTAQQFSDIMQQAFEPLSLACYSFFIACVAGGFLSFIIAAIMKTNGPQNSRDNSTTNL